MPKNGPFLRPELEVKQCYQIGHFLQDKNWWKRPKLKSLKMRVIVYPELRIAPSGNQGEKKKCENPKY